jgi:hypothetical protein
MLSHRVKSSIFEILGKIEGKEANFFSKIYHGHLI